MILQLIYKHLSYLQFSRIASGVSAAQYTRTFFAFHSKYVTAHYWWHYRLRKCLLGDSSASSNLSKSGQSKGSVVYIILESKEEEKMHLLLVL